ncbi:Bacteroides conjugation system ATPase, TraG family [Chitinophaga eiseniae]|uniref:Bacteroides conjugation system ATPase, TraG family n=1 Tax=Chitinophaga eiseniae TaxID=634771 RepID=A0A1T4MNI5_9BACT|nr:TraG family conjugative transposon ATPase [Chitinophaga eiseniae]SJZ68278.1 Bacteroides conjugation system ATPase, TraG family [Chitinophaga eiseniae]
MEKVLEEMLPIMAVEHDCILAKNGDVTVAFQVQLPEVFTLSAGEYEALHQTFIKAIKALPKYSVFHKQDWFVNRRYKGDFEKDGDSFLSRSSSRFFNERPFLDHTCYIMLTKKLESRKPSTSLFSSLCRRSIVPGELLQGNALRDFMDAAGQFKSILEGSGFIKVTRLSDTDLISEKKRAGLLERYCSLSPDQDKPLSKDIFFGEDIRVGDDYLQIYTLSDVASLPGLCGSRINYDKYSSDRCKYSVGFAAALGQLLSCNHLYNQYIFVGDASLKIQQLEKKRLRLQSLSAYSRQNAVARDAVNDFLQEAIGQQRLPVQAHFNVCVWSSDKDELKELKNQVATALSQMDASTKQETVGAPQIYWAGIPGNEGDFPMNDTFDSFCEQACCFLNLETSYRSSTSPFGIRLGDRQTGRPLHVDLSDEPMKQGITTNRNKIVIGGSGSGKSMFMCSLLRSYCEQGAHCVVLDVGGSYAGLCKLLNGYYFSYTEQDPIRFNPFYISENDTLDIEKRESIKTLLLALWKRESETFNRSEYVALSNALQLYYEKLEKDKSIFPCFDSFYEFLQEDYVSVLEKERVQQKDFDINNLLYVLKPYYKGGEFSYLLNARENLNLLDERFVVVELDNIKDHPILFSAVTLLVAEMFISKMRKLKGVRKVITIEEAWKAIMRSGMAEFMKYLYKTVRKFFGEAITVTQELSDLISSPVVKEAIISNADCKILLDMRKFQNKFDDIQALLGLSDKGKEMVLSVNRSNEPGRRYREVFIDLGGQVMKVYRYEPSPEEYYAFSTEESEKVKVMAYAERYGGDIKRGIAALVQDLHYQQN